MTTQARIHANRLNAQKSTGPKTQKGKEIVAQNALKHGLSARHDVIITENQADFDLHRDSLLEELDPQGPMESMLADRIVSLSWRLKRADRIQNQTIDAMHEANESNLLTNLTKSFGLKALATPQPSNPDLTLGRIALKDFANARVLDRLLMYERRIENSLQKTIIELQRLTLIRSLEHPNAAEVEPEPADPPVAEFPSIETVPATPHGRPAPNVESPLTQNNHPIQPSLPLNNALFTQNKPNPRTPKITATLATAKNYEQKPPLRDSEKQTQSNPIPRAQDACPEGDIRHPTYNIRKTNPLSIPSAPPIVYNRRQVLLRI